MKSYKFKIRGHEYGVEIKSVEGNVFNIEVNGTKYTVEMDREVKTSKTPTLVRNTVSTHKTITKKDSNSITKVKCPLPGNIMNIFVKKGDKVQKGDKLMMYEAMKMENQILAEKDGVIAAVKVNVGDSVLQDDVVIEMK
jgi:biotin carboxyl carrier protein